MTTTTALIRRNTKLFFKDKGMFFSAMITPAILLLLYSTFLFRVFRSSFEQNLPDFIQLPERLIDGLVGGQMISSLLAVSCVTVAFCSNLLMVQDKVNGSIKDLRMTPVRASSLSIGYYAATLISTLIVCLTATALCLLYLATLGWYLSSADVLLLILDVVLLVLFGVALSSIINFFLSTQGQMSAVGTIISSAYGFICGAYMPLSNFSEGLRKVLSFLPGTYGTSLVRNHAMRGALAELSDYGVPGEVVEAIRDSLDCNLYFFGRQVALPTMYVILAGSVAVLVGVYVLQNRLKNK